MDYTKHVGWPFKQPNFWKTWALLSCLSITMFGPFCYAAELTKNVAKNGVAEAKFPKFSVETCCSNNILLWLCYICIGLPFAIVGVVFAFMDWSLVGRIFTSLATFSYFVYFPAFLICGASEDNTSSVYSTFFKLPFLGLKGYYNLVFIYVLWQGAVGAITVIPATLVVFGILALAFKNFIVGGILICVFALLLMITVLVAQPYVFMALASLVGDFMRNYRNELIEKDILDEKTYLMQGSLEE